MLRSEVTDVIRKAQSKSTILRFTYTLVQMKSTKPPKLLKVNLEHLYLIRNQITFVNETKSLIYLCIQYSKFIAAICSRLKSIYNYEYLGLGKTQIIVVSGKVFCVWLTLRGHNWMLLAHRP